MPKVNLSNYEGGREQAYVKHSLLEIYLPELAFRVGKKWDVLAYVDGFAGPWKTHDPDHADSSFRIAIETLRRSQAGLREWHGRELRVTCILVEQDKGAFAELQVLAGSRGSTGVEYKKLFCEAMFFPLVTPNDLVKWLRALEPNIEITLDGVPSRKKPKPSEDYRVVVINSKALH